MNAVTDPPRNPGLNDQWTTSGRVVQRTSMPNEWIMPWAVGGTHGLSAFADGDIDRFFYFPLGTNSGGWVAVPEPSPMQAAVAELRKRSHLTWEQLARIFGVQRRSLHFWARGTRPSFENTERIQRLLIILRHVDTGDPERTRAQLLRPIQDGTSVYELLCGGRDEEVLAILRSSRRQPQPMSLNERSRRPPALSSEVRERRRGFAPTELLDTKHDDAPALGRLIGSVPIPCKV